MTHWRWCLLLPALLHCTATKSPKTEVDVWEKRYQRMEERFELMESRLWALEQKLQDQASADPGTTETATQDQTPAAKLQSNPIEEPGPQESLPAPAVIPAFGSAMEHYHAGLSAYRNQRFGEAATHFESFLERYPDDRLTPNALYWHAETHYARKAFNQAFDAFRLVQERYPRHAKAPHALYKMILCCAPLNRPNLQKELTQTFLSTYPQSELRHQLKATAR